MERAARVAEAVLAGAELAEVFGGFGDGGVEEVEDDAAGRGGVYGDVELCERSERGGRRERRVSERAWERGREGEGGRERGRRLAEEARRRRRGRT